MKIWKKIERKLTSGKEKEMKIWKKLTLSQKRKILKYDDNCAHQYRQA